MRRQRRQREKERRGGHNRTPKRRKEEKLESKGLNRTPKKQTQNLKNGKEKPDREAKIQDEDRAPKRKAKK